MTLFMRNLVSSLTRGAFRGRILFLLFISLAFYGCNSINSLKNARNEPGNAQSYSVPYDTAFETVVNVLQYKGADIIEQNKAERYILAKQGITGYGIGISYGEYLGIYFDPQGEQSTMVKMVQKNRVKTLTDGPRWDGTFFQELSRQIEMRKKQSAAGAVA